MLKNGYYLSCYIAIDELSFLIDFSVRGDQNISLWKYEDGIIDLVHYWELERVTGIKGFGQSFTSVNSAKILINDLLASYKLSLEDMICVWGVPQLSTSEDYTCLKEIPLISYHSIAHLFSALLMDSSIFYGDKMLTFAVDGGPDIVLDPQAAEKYYYCGSYSEKGIIKDIFPVYSPGPMWAEASKLFGMREGTLMALANATTSKLKNIKFNIQMANDVDTASNVSQEIRQSYTYMINVLEEDWGKYVDDYDDRFSKEENLISMFMKEIQRYSMKIMELNVEQAKTKLAIDLKTVYLSLSGGFGLNCPTNSYLIEKFHFKGFIAPPCINDGGMSLGIALYGFYKLSETREIHFKFANAFYGNNDPLDVEHYLKKYNKFVEDIKPQEIPQIIDDILQKPIVWFQGAAEVGPRALGHRSILGNPSSMETKDFLNKVKGRQWWRPVAPLILEQDMDEWVEEGYSSPYMLNIFTVKREKVELIPAVAHHDRSSRMQSITKDADKLLYQILCEMKRRTGIPLLCNTSLNDRGEPIVDTIDEAMNFSLRKGFKIIYINGYRIALKNHDEYLYDKPAERKFLSLVSMSENEIQKRLEVLNPYKVNKVQLAVYIYSPRVRAAIDITKEKDLKKLKLLTNLSLKKHPNVNYGGIKNECS